MDNMFYVTCAKGAKGAVPLENRKQMYAQKQQFDDETAKQILQSASEWFIAMYSEISYDQFYYPGRTEIDKKLWCRELFDDEIAAENGTFAGVVTDIPDTRDEFYDSEYFNKYDMMPAHIAEIKSGETVLIGKNFVTLSSDQDAYKSTYFFLCKKTMSEYRLDESIVSYFDLLWFGKDINGYVFCARSLEGDVPAFVLEAPEKNNRLSLFLLREILIDRNRTKNSSDLIHRITRNGFYYLESIPDDVSGREYAIKAAPEEPVKIDDLPSLIREYLDGQSLPISLRNGDIFII